MWQDVVELRDFYSGSLGHVAQRMIRRRVRELWPDVRGENVLGLGYATPYLRRFRAEAQRVLALMPGRMGVLPWPGEGRNSTAIAAEDELPLADLSMDRILLAHGLECTDQISAYLREVWRVLADGGRLLVVAPNRRGIWARLDHTPFGHGQPFSMDQLHQILRQSMFVPVRSLRALYVPPGQRRFLLAAAPAWENIGNRWFQPLAGVVLVEATKQTYAGTTVSAAPRRRYAPVGATSGGRDTRRSL